jgi:hypothetical protein
MREAVPAAIPDWLAGVDFRRIVRLDVGLEGDWSGSVRAVWTRDAGFLGLPADGLRHVRFRPALELYFEGGWIGLHCFQTEPGGFALDAAAVHQVVAFLERVARG